MEIPFIGKKMNIFHGKANQWPSLSILFNAVVHTAKIVLLCIVQTELGHSVGFGV